MLSWLNIIFSQPFYGRQKRLSKSRKANSKKEFFESFERVGIEKEAASLVWNALMNEAVFDGFLPAPDDDLLYTYGIVDDDLDELVIELLNQYKCKLPLSSDIEKMSPVRTVYDLVCFLSEIKKRNMTELGSIGSK